MLKPPDRLLSALYFALVIGVDFYQLLLDVSQLGVFMRLNFYTFLQGLIQDCDFLSVDFLLFEKTFTVGLLGVVWMNLMRVS